MLAHQTARQDNRNFTLRWLISWAIAVVSLAILLAGVWSTSAVGQQAASPLNPSRPATYRNALIYGLKARLPSEVAYVKSVVTAVGEGKISARLVNQTFFWARTHAGVSPYGQRNRPIIYFIAALNARLKKLQLKVDLTGGLP